MLGIRFNKPFAWFFLFFGLFLIGVNFYGTNVDFTSPVKKPTKMTYEEALALIDMARTRENKYEKIVFVNEAVANTISGQWQDNKYFRYPFSKNYLLHFMYILEPVFSYFGFNELQFQPYEYPDHYATLQRGTAIGSGYAIAVSGFLNEMGVKTAILALSGHVVAMSEIPGEANIIIDANYNVVLPFGIMHAKQFPAEVIKYYMASGYSESQAQKISKIFQGREAIFWGGAGNYSSLILKVEKIAQNLKWFIPIIMVIFSLVSIFQWHKLLSQKLKNLR